MAYFAYAFPCVGMPAGNAIGARGLLKFFMPTLAIWLIGPTLSLIDTAVVGSKSSTQLAALGPGCILCDCNGYFFTFLAVASMMPPWPIKVDRAFVNLSCWQNSMKTAFSCCRQGNLKCWFVFVQIFHLAFELGHAIREESLFNQYAFKGHKNCC